MFIEHISIFYGVNEMQNFELSENELSLKILSKTHLSFFMPQLGSSVVCELISGMLEQYNSKRKGSLYL